MELINITTEELINIINDYIKDKYSYNYADVFEDTIQYHLEDESIVNIYVNVESESE